MKTKFFINALSVLTIIVVAGCSQGGFGGKPGSEDLGAGIAGSLLGMTGVVTGSQASSIFKAGSKLAKASRGLTEEQEYYIGRGVSALILADYKASNNAALNSYVNKVGLALAAFSDRPDTFSGYHFLVLDTEEYNALSAPSGFIFVSKGLLRLMPDEEALAAVLAHEIGHVVKGHGVAAIREANLTEAFSIIGQEAASSAISRTNVGGVAGAVAPELMNSFKSSIGDVFTTIAKKGYSRSQEYEADEYAVQLLAKAGYNPNGLPAMLNALSKIENSAKGGWFDTHPTPEKRLSNIDGEIPPGKSSPQGEKLRLARFVSATKHS